MSPKTVTTTQEIKSRRASAVPGDNLRELTQPMRDTDGYIWPRGTRYRPASGGRNNVSGQDERTVTIVGA